MSFYDQTKSSRPWTLARVGGTAVSRLKSGSWSSMASLISDNGTDDSGSVRSIPITGEPKSDGKVGDIGELQRKLDDANAALTSKDDSITELLGRVKTLEESLESARAETTQQIASLQASDEAKARAETDSADLRERLTSLQAEHSRDLFDLEATRRELDNTRAEVVAQTNLITTLQSRIHTAEAERDAAREEEQAVRTSAGEDISAKETELEAERVARLTAEAELEMAYAKIADIEAAHSQTHQEVQSKTADLADLSSRLESLSANLAAIHAEKEDKASRVFDLEAHIAQAEQEREEAQRERNEALDQVRNLDERILEMTAAMQRAAEDAEKRNCELKAAKEDAEKRNCELKAAKEAAGALVEQVQHARSEVAREEEMILVLQSQVHEGQQRSEEDEVVVDQLKTELARSRAAEASLVEQLKTLSRRGSELERQVGRLRDTQFAGCTLQ
ncbi:uncharacterized protein FIBRA_06286 [Fibroporia radiculosa]|uniref:Uncharacterized protein n=1 Tax=Fibroporia radiculosa TaxID=599839 RepID=J4GSH0_9APHY|nr:uncharacterized protein FIBRA_06286 [Fibroporia radiculosa]CCM04125.1 predicted protein [Fibroporia radiculosa]